MNSRKGSRTIEIRDRESGEIIEATVVDQSSRSSQLVLVGDETFNLCKKKDFTKFVKLYDHQDAYDDPMYSNVMYAHGFGEQPIKFYRVLRAMTQAQFARKTGIAQPQISKYESGEVLPLSQNLQKIAKALDMPIKIVLDGVLTQYIASVGDFINDSYSDSFFQMNIGDRIRIPIEFTKMLFNDKKIREENVKLSIIFEIILEEGRPEPPEWVTEKLSKRVGGKK